MVQCGTDTQINTVAQNTQKQQSVNLPGRGWRETSQRRGYRAWDLTDEEFGRWMKWEWHSRQTRMLPPGKTQE